MRQADSQYPGCWRVSQFYNVSYFYQYHVLILSSSSYQHVIKNHWWNTLLVRTSINEQSETWLYMWNTYDSVKNEAVWFLFFGERSEYIPCILSVRSQKSDLYWKFMEHVKVASTTKTGKIQADTPNYECKPARGFCFSPREYSKGK